MTRPKTKRIVWTLAVLLALSFVAVMVFHKHEEPIIIGNLSKEDAAKISRLALHQVRFANRRSLIYYLHTGEIKKVITHSRSYLSAKVLRLERLPNGLVSVTMKIKPDLENVDLLAGKEDGEWRIIQPGM